MKMNIKIKAGFLAAGLIATVIGSSLLTSYILDSMTAEQIKYLITAGVVGIFVYLSYSIALSHLEYKENIKKISDRINKLG
jgi:hypothetical protein